MDLRTPILKLLNCITPVRLEGDAKIHETNNIELSCLINFYGRTYMLRNILSCLREQHFNRKKFEVILVEDKEGTNEGKSIAKEFSKSLNLKYITLNKNFGVMGYSRNFGLVHCEGKYILILDDDTVILDNNFLEKLLQEFELRKADVILPKGLASFSIVKNRYQYHDPYFPTNRCVAYNRKTLCDLKGFISEIIGQEDVEFTVRLLLANKKILESENLCYFHPPLLFDSYKKSAAVGISFYKLKNKYPFIMWLSLIANGCRYLPLAILPINEKFRNQSKFSIGFIQGIWYAITGKDVEYR